MILIVILVFLILITLSGVSVLNRMQQHQRERRFQQRKLRIEVEELAEIVSCLEQTLSNRTIIKHINDRIVTLQRQMLAREEKNRAHIEAAILKTERHSEELLSSKNRQPINYQRESDAQITKTQLYLNEAMHLITQLAAQNMLSEVELDSYLGELRWAYLMVSVMSYIGQGDKSMAISDRFSAQAFYRKAQQLLIESMHQDPRRIKMIKELSEIIEGDRAGLSRELSSGL